MSVIRSFLLNGEVQGLRRRNSGERKRQWNQIACRNIRNNQIKLIQTHSIGGEACIGDRRLSLSEEDMERKGNRVVLLHDLAGGNVRTYRSEANAIKSYGIPRLRAARRLHPQSLQEEEHRLRRLKTTLRRIASHQC